MGTKRLNKNKVKLTGLSCSGVELPASHFIKIFKFKIQLLLTMAFLANILNTGNSDSCGVEFSTCYNCVYNGRILVKLASNFTYCCVRNPGALEEPIMMTYSKLNDCPADMTGTYVLSASIGLTGFLIALVLFAFICCKNRRGRMFPRVRYSTERQPLLSVTRDYDGMPNYGINDSHAAAAAALGSTDFNAPVQLPPPPPPYTTHPSLPSTSTAQPTSTCTCRPM